MDLTTALEWAGGHRTAVLVTIRSDGRPQTSDVNVVVRDGTFEISMTADRAKTANLRRDPRCVVHISDPAKWSYVSFDATAELSPVAASPDDETADALVAYYRDSVGEHPDWAEYREAMVTDRRLLARVTPRSVVGMVNS